MIRHEDIDNGQLYQKMHKVCSLIVQTIFILLLFATLTLCAPLDAFVGMLLCGVPVCL
jgi:hypothetical protein